MKKILYLSLILIFLFPAASLAAFSPSDYQFFKVFQVDNEGFSYISLDQEVLANTGDDLADIRLSDSSGQEIAYQLTPLAAALPEARVVQAVNESRKPGEYGFILDMGEASPLHNQLVLDIESDKDYMADLYLEGSEDQKQWAAVKNYKIFKVAPHYANTTFDYPVSSWRFMRVRITAQPLPLLALKSIKVFFINQADTHFDMTSPTIVSIGPSANAGHTQIIIDVGCNGYYIQDIYVNAADRNFERPVRIFTGSSQDNWQLTGSGWHISHFLWSGYEAGEDKIALNQRVMRYVKIEIEDGSSPPLNISQVTVKGSYPRLLADLKPGSYRLWYGSIQASKPQYDIARFYSLIETSNIPFIHPGSQGANPYYVDARPWSEKNRWLLNAALIMAVFVLGGLLVKNLVVSENK